MTAPRLTTLPADFPTMLRDYGLVVRVHNGEIGDGKTWQQRGTSGSQAAEGMVLHHDGWRQGASHSAFVIQHAYDSPRFPGQPVYMGGIWLDGGFDLWCGGRHVGAGAIDVRAHDAVVHGRAVPAGGYTGTPPSTINSTGKYFNFVLHGGANSAGQAADTFTDAQIHSAVLLGNVLVHELGYPVQTLVEHRQLARYRGKPDPAWGSRLWSNLVSSQLPPKDVIMPDHNPPQQLVSHTATANNAGVYLLMQDGAVWTFGNVTFHGAANDGRMGSARAVRLVVTGGGYDVIDSAGKVHSFRPLPTIRSTQLVGATVTYNGQQYKVVA